MEGAVDPGWECLQFLTALGQDLHHISPGLQIGVGPFNRFLKGSVCPCDDDHIRILSGLCGSPDLADHLFRADHLGCLDKRAVRGLLLILNKQSGHPGLFIFPDCTDHVHGAAIAALGICQDRDVHCIHHFAQDRDRLVQRQKSRVRLPQHYTVHPVASRPGNRKSSRFNRAGAECIIGTGCDQVIIGRQQFSHFFTLSAHGNPSFFISL